MHDVPWRPVGLSEVARLEAPIYPAVAMSMPHVQVYTNADKEMADVVRGAYAARIGRPGAVRIMALPEGAMVHGQAQFLLSVGDLLVEEQIPPHWRADSGGTLPPRRALAELNDVDGDVMLIARFGCRTWGHWLGELLPKIAVCEWHFPNRYFYALPQEAIDIEKSGVIARRIRESLAAYGVPMGRVLPLSGKPYRFSRLFAMTGVWTDRMMHPQVMATMQETVRLPHAVTSAVQPRVALLRGDNDRRQMTNADAVKACLRARDFAILDIAELSFTDQVRVFMKARQIFSILGSSLSGLIFAEEGVDVTAVAPARFADRFFYALMQAKGARYAEVRGPVVGEPLPMYRDSAFEVPIGDLEAALAALGEA
jgi:capsular polysaccharide biosynthesis protein